MADELDEIRRDARTAQMMREGVNGGQADAADLKTRLNGGDPAAGRALRGQPPADMSEVRNRLVAGGAADQPQMPLRESIQRAAEANAPEQARLDQRLSTTTPAQAPAVPPRNVPLGTPGGASPAAGAIQVNSAGQAGVVTNPNTRLPEFGGMSREAEAFLKQRAATPGSSGVQGVANAATPVPPTAAAPAAGAAAPAVAPAAAAAEGGARPYIEPPPSTISRVASGALKVGGAAIPIGVEAYRANSVMDNPRATTKDKINQAVGGAIEAGGAILGGAAGAATGSVAGPVGAIAGGVAGGAGGHAVAQEAVKSLRAFFGLPERSPYELLKGGGAGRGFINPPAAQPSEQKGTPDQQVSAPVQKTIAGVGQQAAASAASGSAQGSATKTAPVRYELGKNAVEVYNGAESHVQLFGPNGERSSVPTNVFQAGPEAIARYADEVRAAQSRAMEDPTGQLARQRLENEGRVATQSKANEGHIAGIREQIKAPVPIKDAMGNTTALATPQPGGDPRITNVQSAGPKPALAKAHADAKAAVAAGADPESVNKMLGNWGYPSLKFGNK